MAGAAGNENSRDTAARIQTNLAGTNGISQDHLVQWIRGPPVFRKPFPFNTIQDDSEQSAEVTGRGTCGRWHGQYRVRSALATGNGGNGNAFEPNQENNQWHRIFRIPSQDEAWSQR